MQERDAVFVEVEVALDRAEEHPKRPTAWLGWSEFELRCAERKFISLTRRAVSHSSASAETAAVPRENDLLC
jgi:hypothetical protein